MKTPALTKLAVSALEDLKGQDIVVLDVKKLTPMTDVMIVCTGTSTRHVKSLAQNVVDDVKEAGERPLGIEGLEQGEWALVDLNGVIVHVMQTQTRAFYQIEKLWQIDVTDAADEADRPVAKKKPKSGPKPASKVAKTKTGAGAKKTAKTTVTKTVKKGPAATTVKSASAKPRASVAKPKTTTAAKKPVAKNAVAKPAVRRVRKAAD